MAQTKKLSVGTVFGKIKVEHYSTVVDGKIVPNTSPRTVARFGGLCVTSKMVPVAQYPDKPATAFMGDFVGINPDTGEESRASTLYLPDIAGTWLLTQLARPETKGVEFLLDVQVLPSDNTRPGAMPYMYTFTHVMPATESDPIARLLAAGQAAKPIAALKLAAPATPAPATPTEPEKAKGKK
jgi:hypothetical protein